MGVILHRTPDVENPVMIAGWPGIGNIGIIAVDALRSGLQAEEFGEIEPWEFFYPKKVLIRNGQLEHLEFPTNKLYFSRTESRDLIIFIGEEQPSEMGKTYAEGEKAYRMANLVLDVAQQFACTRVYTSGAAVAPVHHTARPRVWAVPNSDRLIEEWRGYENTVLMSGIEGRSGQGSITGLNGLLLGVARRRGLDGVCVMGEIPVYLQGLPLPYPKASKSVLEVLTKALGITVDLEGIAQLAESTEKEVERLYALFPAEAREQLDRLKAAAAETSTDAGQITEEDKRKILEDIEKFFGREQKEE